ncbi:coenzyme Q-binding protein COQ10 homolog B, mitochondrial [Anabrus simplex]|uniref:coenzyme Q-binding protein COQ10 homolog B, mitochondrial n=1 Tax=Anabrus simplex TaxID=316456 RepID=UPI0034DDC2B5
MGIFRRYRIGFRVLTCHSRQMGSVSSFSSRSPVWCTAVVKQCSNSGQKFEQRRNDVITPLRCFFNLPSISMKRKEYAGRKLVGFSMEQMYNVVSDVENYKKFVPFCHRSIVLSKRPGHLKADLAIGFPPVQESYTSSVTMIEPHLVKAECTEGKLFNHLLTVWKFSPGLKNTTNSCIIDFAVSFEFRSALHSQLAHVFFNEVVRQMEKAFLEEAANRYGKPSIPTKLL